MSKNYEADSIEVLEGLEPVKKRPGMYTDTTRPNHLAQEVIDNSVDEALEGFATEIHVTLRKDGSMSVSDNGRGMPVDIHKKEKLPGVELILTRLHSGAKFNSDSYKFSGRLHGVGVSVVNALSESFEVFIKREGKTHHMAFRDGEKSGNLICHCHHLTPHNTHNSQPIAPGYMQSCTCTLGTRSSRGHHQQRNTGFYDKNCAAEEMSS